jgi:hypothetical protein
MSRTVADRLKELFVEKYAHEHYGPTPIQQIFREKDATDLNTNEYEFTISKQPISASFGSDIDVTDIDYESKQIQFEKFGIEFNDAANVKESIRLMKESISSRYYNTISKELLSERLDVDGSIDEVVHDMYSLFQTCRDVSPSVAVIPEIDCRGTVYEDEPRKLDEDTIDSLDVHVDWTGTVEQPIIADASMFGYDAVRTELDLNHWYDEHKEENVHQIWTRRGCTAVHPTGGLKVLLS